MLWPSASFAQQSLNYFHFDGTTGDYKDGMDSTAPTAAGDPGDYNGDGNPGHTIVKGYEASLSQERRLDLISAPQAGGVLAGTASFTFWINDQGNSGNYDVYVRVYVDADGVPDGSDLYDTLIGSNVLDPPSIATDNDAATWHEVSDTWNVSGTIPAGHRLVFRITNGESSFGDYWVGYDRVSYPSLLDLSLASGLGTLDIDGNSQIEPVTDGLLVLRRQFGFTGAVLIASAVGQGCTRCTANEIESYIASLGSTLDIDGNLALAPLSDGLLILRYLFGFTGPELTDSAVGQGCARCDASTILPYLQTLD